LFAGSPVYRLATLLSLLPGWLARLLTLLPVWLASELSEWLASYPSCIGGLAGLVGLVGLDG
jgi:hypothetical protein